MRGVNGSSDLGPGIRVRVELQFQAAICSPCLHPS